MTAPARRAALGAILAAPLTGGAVMALPSDSPQRTAPSDLAAACDWGVAHLAWINDTSHPLGDWPDGRLEAELDRVDDVLTRVADEPSAGLSDLAAKARIVLASDGQHLSMSDHAADRALLTVLGEVIAQCT